MSSETKICPFCAEEIKKAAKLCKHCHSVLDDDQYVPTNEEQNSILPEVPPIGESPAQPQGSGQPIHREDSPTISADALVKVSCIYCSLVAVLLFLSFLNSGVAMVVLLFSFPLGLACFAGLFFRPWRIAAFIGWQLSFVVFGVAAWNMVRLQSPEVVNAQYESQLRNEAADRLAKDQREQEAQAEKQKKAQEAPEPLVMTGETGLLNSPARTGDSEKAMDEMYSALASKDNYGLQELKANGEIVELPAGTQVHVLGRSGFLSSITKVRILSGERYGEIRYVGSDQVGRSVKPDATQ